MKALEIKNLTKSYGSFKAVDQVSFTLEKGEIFGLLGPNGAGKTSLISCIVSLEKIDAGQIAVLDLDVEKKPKLAKAHLGYVPQEVINHGYFSVKEILQFYSGYFGLLNNNDRIDFLLEKLSLTPHKDKKVKQLSGGMKRRLMIAKALVHQPQVLLLDEPTAGVDIELRNDLWNFVRELRDSGTTILLTTHYLEEAESLCDRVAIIDRGKVLKIGNTKELISDLTFRQLYVFTKETVSCVKSPYLKSQTEKEIVLEFPASMEISEVLSSVDLKLEDIKDFSIKEGSLEEAFVKVLNKEGDQ